MSRDPQKGRSTDMRRDGFVTRITRELYRNLIGEAKSDVAPPAQGSRILDSGPEPGRWKWLQDVMQQSIEQARMEANEHREIASDQLFAIERIELLPEGEAVRQSLERFMREFSGEARVRWIKRMWPGHARDGISVDALHDVSMSPAREPDQAASPEGDEYDRALRAKATANESGGKLTLTSLMNRLLLRVKATANDGGGWLEIRFLGAWQQEQSVHLPQAPRQGGLVPAQATVLVHDAEGQRAVEMRELDLVLGSAGDIPVHGKYVSRRHLRLFVDDGRLWVEDPGSTNGVWLGDVQLSPNERREVGDNADFRLGAPSHALSLTERECPRVMVTRVVARVPDRGATPVLGGALTPVLGGQHRAGEARAPLLLLTLAAVGWRQEGSVHGLPFTIGRSRTCDFCLPEDNEAVSGCHLRLVDLGLPNGVWVEDAGSTRGSYLRDERRAGRFLLPFGEPLILGGSSLSDRHRPVKLVVLRAADQEKT